MITAYRWESNWKILVLVAVIVPVLLRLGFWQLQRADEKIQLQAIYDEQQSLPAIFFEQLPAVIEGKGPNASENNAKQNLDTLLSSRRVLLSGTFNNQQTILLDNQIVGGKAGYDVISPFVTSKGALVLINRGWVAGFADRKLLPNVDLVNGTVEIEASIHIPLGKAVTLAADQWSDGWPLVVQWLDMPRIDGLLTRDLYPHALRIEDGQIGVLQRHWQPINTQPEKHWGYAVQWFLMGLSLTIYWVYSSLKKK